MITRFFLAVLGILQSVAVVTAAEPFESCPTKAFIIQTPGPTPISYGVDLAIGSYATLTDDMGTSKVNGAGFSIHDNYIYGWDYGTQTLAQFGSDYQATPLELVNLIDKPFYVGDMSVNENAWYGYRRGYGLFRVGLEDPDSSLEMEKIATHASMGNPVLTDLAFHPYNGLIYAVDNDGFLLEIDPSNGQTIELAQVLSEATEGFNFTFGAQYFDANENLYLSNNSNGYIYRVTLDGINSEAVFFTYGPSSSSNDGARCALAEIEISDGVDFGDAPDSYGTTLANAGARHGVSLPRLGASADSESDAYAFPMSDDTSDNSNDEDGVSFPTGFEIANSSIIVIEVTGTNGYLNAWIDWDQDGQFDYDERIAEQLQVSNGINTISVAVPIWATVGETWARFRVSTFADIGPTGGVSDGEVEDYQLTITESGVSTRHYPSADSFSTFAYEDLFPQLGDFDMNDVLMNVRFTEYIKDNQIIRLKIEGQLAALGATYHNGFAIQLPDIDPDSVKENSIQLVINHKNQSGNILESNRDNAVLIVSENLWSITEKGEADCNYFRVESGCGTSHRPSWSITIPLREAIDLWRMPAMPYDPFIFASPETYRGDQVSQITGQQPGRKLEVHLKNKAPTSAFNHDLFDSFDDASQASSQFYFQTAAGIPWALEMPTDWKHPKEGISLLKAYPQFFDFALDPSGQTNPQWYLESNANADYLYND